LKGWLNWLKERKLKRLARIKTANVNNTHDVRRISVNKTYRGKTMHLLMEINNGVIEGLVDIGTYMSVIAASII